MKSYKLQMLILVVGFATMMSIPYLVPGTGLLALFGLVPLLWMDKIASNNNCKKVWLWHYSAFVLWNAITTFWIWNATAGGAIFAILANSLQMSLIFGTFRLSKKYFNGTVPYIFLMAMWIAWERLYLGAQISWPWLLFGNAFARSISLIQWYEFTGALGGSLWVWACNLAIFSILSSLADNTWKTWNAKAKTAVISLTLIIFLVPIISSEIIFKTYKETNSPLEVAIIQPNIDPYNKFKAMDQSEQNHILLDLMNSSLKERYQDSSYANKPLLVVAPETFTNDVEVNNIEAGYSFNQFKRFLQDYPGVNLLFGASTYEFIQADKAPSYNARQANDGLWYHSHNSAIIMDGNGRNEIFHKSKLVVGVEMTPYPAFFSKIDSALGGVMGRCVGQKEITNLNCKANNSENIPIGCAICYESVYGEYCTGYIKKGAKALAVITNDAWWGNTPGYKQHLSYSSLRAIETRRDIARCANTGISAIINQKGEVLEQSAWWEPAVIKGSINLNDATTFFVSNGDIIGKLCLFIFTVLGLGLISKIVIKTKE